MYKCNLTFFKTAVAAGLVLALQPTSFAAQVTGNVGPGPAVTGANTQLGVGEMPGGPATSNGAGRMQGAIMTPVGGRILSSGNSRPRSHMRIFNGIKSPDGSGQHRGVDINPTAEPSTSHWSTQNYRRSNHGMRSLHRRVKHHHKAK